MSTMPNEDELVEEIDRELRLVDTAIEMVRRGISPRVTVANLPLGAAVLGSARVRAERYRVRVRPAWGPGDSARSLVVEGRSDG